MALFIQFAKRDLKAYKVVIVVNLNYFEIKNILNF